MPLLTDSDERVLDSEMATRLHDRIFDSRYLRWTVNSVSRCGGVLWELTLSGLRYLCSLGIVKKEIFAVNRLIVWRATTVFAVIRMVSARTAYSDYN